MRKYTKQKKLSFLKFKSFSFYALDMKRKLAGDGIGNDSALSNYKLQFVSAAPERHYQQGVYNLLTCTTIWNYAHFYIDTHFDHSVLRRIFMLRSDLFCVRALRSLAPKWLVNTSSCPCGWSWWFCTLVGGRSMKSHSSLVGLWVWARVSLRFISSSICAKFQSLFIPHLQWLSCEETTEQKKSFVVYNFIVSCSIPLQHSVWSF